MILGVMKKRQYIDQFLHYGAEDTALPIGPMEPETILPTENNADAHLFAAE
jgi:hypothetical protein